MAGSIVDLTDFIVKDCETPSDYLSISIPGDTSATRQEFGRVTLWEEPEEEEEKEEVKPRGKAKAKASSQHFKWIYADLIRWNTFFFEIAMPRKSCRYRYWRRADAVTLRTCSFRRQKQRPEENLQRRRSFCLMRIEWNWYSYLMKADPSKPALAMVHEVCPIHKCRVSWG